MPHKLPPDPSNWPGCWQEMLPSISVTDGGANSGVHVLGGLELITRPASAALLLGFHSRCPTIPPTSPGRQSRRTLRCSDPMAPNEFPGAAFSRASTGSSRFVAEEGAVLEQLVRRGPTGKDDSGDSGFQQPWEAAAGPLLPAFCECGPARHAPAEHPHPFPPLCPQQRSAAPRAPAPCMTHHPCSFHPPWIPALLCLVTLPLGS